MKRILIGLVVLALIAGGAFYVMRDRIALTLFRAAAERGMAANIAAELPDGLTVAFCGTGSPMPDRTRAGPCTAIIAGQHVFVFDAGDGATETLARMGIPTATIDAVFLTHLHSDHIDGLGGLSLQRWATGGIRTQLPVYAGEGVERVTAGFNEAYAIDSGHRVAHHGADIVPPEGFGMAPHLIQITEGAESTVAFDQDGVRVIAFHVPHGPVREALGFRIEYGGRSVVLSGDTARSEELIRAARGADVLVHEGLSPELVGIMEETARAQNQDGLARIFHDILNYHTSPPDAADVAQEAGVGALAFTHLIPPLPVSIMEGPFLADARQRYTGPLWIMRDGDVIILPAAGGLERRNTLQ
jgi:ribonuclease Z